MSRFFFVVYLFLHDRNNKCSL